MNIQERINYYAENLSIPFFIKSYIKLEKLDDEIKRNIKRDPDWKSKLQFTSQDLRRYVIALERVHKAFNKRLSFVEFNKRLQKYDKIDNKVLQDEVISDSEYMRALSYCQAFLSRANYWATITYLIEKKHEYIKEQSDKTFNDEILGGILEILNR